MLDNFEKKEISGSTWPLLKTPIDQEMYEITQLVNWKPKMLDFLKQKFPLSDLAELQVLGYSYDFDHVRKGNILLTLGYGKDPSNITLHNIKIRPSVMTETEAILLGLLSKKLVPEKNIKIFMNLATALNWKKEFKNKELEVVENFLEKNNIKSITLKDKDLNMTILNLYGEQTTMRAIPDRWSIKDFAACLLTMGDLPKPSQAEKIIKLDRNNDCLENGDRT